MNNAFSLEQIAKTGDLNADLIIKQYKLDEMANFMEIKSTNPKLKQSGRAKELNKASSTLQRYRSEINMLPSCRIPPSSNNQRRKEKTSNQTEIDLKTISNDLKMTSNAPYKKRKKIKGADPSDNQNDGRAFKKQACSSI